MTGLDWRKAPIGLREALSFTRSRVVELDRLLRAAEGVEGCVLLSTCNRTELYLSCASGAEPEPGALLCAAAGLPYAPFAGAFVTRTGEEAARHLMEVAGGLRSQIWGEDQILTQVKGAAAAAREAGTADGVLEILFRNAAAAGKEIKTKVPLTGVPRSAAQSAVERLARDAGGLEGKRALVIGNGEMGRLSAALLHRLGCAVTVTLRTYRHGETVVPAGCAVAPYEERYAAMKGVDLLLSATTSPHYTISARELAAVEDHPRLLADLAIPRDIEPAVGELPGVTLYNVDSLGVDTRREVPAAAAEIVERHLEQMAQWENYRSCLPGLERVKQAVAARVLSTDLDGPEARGLVELAVGRAVDLLSGALKENLTPEELERCARKIEVHTAAKPRWPLPEQRPLRFPLFVNLAGEKAVVVGGGAVACRRAEVLSRFGAEVTVIAPRCKNPPQGIQWEGRPYAPGDLAGAALAVAATDDRAVNRAVGEEAKAQGIPVSVADCPEECTFFFPAVCTGENLVAGVIGRGRRTPHRPGGRAYPQRIGGIGMKTIRVGSRESRLAVVQSELVMDAIRAAHPEVELELVTMKTTGDKILDRTLDKVGGKGLFVKELDAALLDGRVDLTIHSCKDLPMEEDPRIPLAGFSRREDPRDALVLPQGAEELDPSRPIGCASARRAVQLRALFPGVAVAPVRGNVLTRLRKLDEGQFSALVLAAAGLKRLGLEARITRYFTVEELLPAAGQGILALQTRAGGGAVLSGRRTGRRRDRLRPGRAGLCPRPGRGLLRPHRGPRPAGGRYRDHRRTVCNRRGRSAAGAAQRPPRPGGGPG